MTDEWQLPTAPGRRKSKPDPLLCRRAMIVAVIATGLLGEAVGFGGDADATAATGVPAGTQALFDRARQIADPWVVQIITVGGVQPADGGVIFV